MVETNLKLTKTADVFPIADVLRPTEDGTAQEPDNDNRRDCICMV